MRTVELGAGRGDISFLLAKLGARATLVDSSRIALDQAERIFSANGLSAEFVLADLFDWRPSSRFDASLSFGVLEHFSADQRDYLIRLHTAGELAFISVPNALCVPYRLWKFAMESAKRWPYGFEVPFTASGLALAMSRSFKDVSVTATPLSYHLGRTTGLGPPRLPLDRILGYQLIGVGTSREGAISSSTRFPQTSSRIA